MCSITWPESENYFKNFLNLNSTVTVVDGPVTVIDGPITVVWWSCYSRDKFVQFRAQPSSIFSVTRGKIIANWLTCKLSRCNQSPKWLRCCLAGPVGVCIYFRNFVRHKGHVRSGWQIYRPPPYRDLFCNTGVAHELSWPIAGNTLGTKGTYWQGAYDRAVVNLSWPPQETMSIPCPIPFTLFVDIKYQNVRRTFISVTYTTASEKRVCRRPR